MITARDNFITSMSPFFNDSIASSRLFRYSSLFLSGNKFAISLANHINFSIGVFDFLSIFLIIIFALLARVRRHHTIQAIPHPAAAIINQHDLADPITVGFVQLPAAFGTFNHCGDYPDYPPLGLSPARLRVPLPAF